MKRRGHGPRTLEEWAKWALRRCETDNDVVAVIGGETGTGKSSLALLLMRALHRLQSTTFRVTRQVLWQGGEALLEAARSLPRGSVVVIDEAIVAGGNRRRAMSNENVFVQEFLNTCRTYGLIVFFLIPRVGDLDSVVEGRANWTFLCNLPRGSGMAYENVRVGGPKSRGVYLQERFEFRFPDPAVVMPSEWAEYQAEKARYGAHGADPRASARRLAKEQIGDLIERLTGPGS